MKQINLAIFGSGEGTNAENIILYFQNHPTIKIKLVVSNKANSGILKRASRLNVSTMLLTKELTLDSEKSNLILSENNIFGIVLAGFLKKIPDTLIEVYPNRIINIHPSLLPKFGGKGMYGDYVHKAVLARGETKSGITIHIVNHEYDQGLILEQKSINIQNIESVDDLSSVIRILEHSIYPNAIESYYISVNK